ncbi:hypothetical protein [Desulforamulus aeronauticus]|uniref:Uncharacterized protein n=1 Tax=Desulforamulus aeronauticus DSM 10349 TaxID=1121421 RepID=A0A1M6NYM6_9FIRM|nr:hypothetical protein [Desulforamulus aeronauticus]SHK00793.1 hypothetical protein SAMN02745123_00347 [Desulforamulus aeronauticus DSM 10349]
MGWIVFFFAAWLLALLLVPIKEWRKLWPAGIVGLILLYLIDILLIKLGAISYRTDHTLLYKLVGLPTFYWTSAFPAAMILVYHYPSQNWQRVLYILFTAGLFLGLEIIMGWLGYFYPRQWSSVIAYCLDVGGFLVVISLSRWVLALMMNIKNQ